MSNFGIVTLSIIPVRVSPGHQSEMVTQALFGETFTILDIGNEWSKVQLSKDGYIGWIQNLQWNHASDNISKKFKVNISNSATAIYNGYKINIPVGAFVWKNGHKDALLSLFEFSKNTKTVDPGIFTTPKGITKTARKFLGTPYLWGGKSNFGIDCSGLTQVVYQVNGYQLPRDAYQQAELGYEVSLEDTRKGDLAFFANESGKIIHVGIIYKTKKEQVKIIHASGRVKIDPLDKTGIIVSGDSEEIRYSHNLAYIKRIID